MKVAVLYNQVSGDAPLEDAATIESAKAVKDALQVKGYQAGIVEVWPSDIPNLAKLPCDAFFNMCEWVGKDLHLSSQIAGCLELSGKPWTGGSASNLDELVNKESMKRSFSSTGVFSPKWDLWQVGKKLTWEGSYPAIVKPIAEHCSVGITQKAVVESFVELAKRARLLRRKYGMPVLIEEFIEGREFQVTVLEDTEGKVIVLPIVELVFDKRRLFRHVLTYKGKWMKGSREYSLSRFEKAKLGGGETRKLIDESSRAFRILGCRGYVRFDVRMREDEFYFLEVNVNPAVEDDPEYSMTMAARLAGMDFVDLVDLIMQSAVGEHRSRAKLALKNESKQAKFLYLQR